MSAKRRFHEFLLMTLGTVLVALGVYFFKFPNHFSTGGVSGMGVVLGELFPAITPGTFVSVINVLFLILGFFVLNRGFGLRTVYCSLLFSGLLRGLELWVPMTGPLTHQKMLELFFAVILPALGSAILFNVEASTGGTDIAAMMLKKWSSLDTGMSLLCADVLIAAATLLVFDIETGLFSLLGLVLKSVVVDSVIESLNRKKSFTIITEHPDVICDYITKTLHRGATFWPAEGAYTKQPRYVVLAALSRSQSVSVRRYLKDRDPHAFLLVTNSSEIFGKGFLRV